MPGTPKPGVNWPEIELAWRGGASPSALARVHNVTRQAIEARRNVHGWVRDAEAAALRETATGERVVNPATGLDRKMVADGKRSLTNMQTVLGLLADGATYKLAAQRVGIVPNTLRAWLDSDPEFSRLAKAAEAEAGLRAIGRVSRAGERGDWRADAFLLERLPATRDDFAPRPPNALPEGPAVVLNLVLSAENLATLAAGQPAGGSAPVIEHGGEA